MKCLKNISFENYLQREGICIGAEIEKYKKKSISEETVRKQFRCISRFHTIAKNYNGHDLKSFDNKTGRLVEKYKIEIRILKRHLLELEKVKEFNDIDKRIIQSFSTMLRISETCISKALDSGYFELIRRSMKNNEICLGNSYFNNVSGNEVINIKSLNNICFNMIEFDGIYILSKLKNGGTCLNWNLLIHEYVIEEKLNKSSEDFMEAIISYPVEYMKWIRRYVKNNGEFSNEYYANKLLKALNKYEENKGVNLC